MAAKFYASVFSLLLVAGVVFSDCDFDNLECRWSDLLMREDKNDPCKIEIACLKPMKTYEQVAERSRRPTFLTTLLPLPPTGSDLHTSLMPNSLLRVEKRRLRCPLGCGFNETRTCIAKCWKNHEWRTLTPLYPALTKFGIVFLVYAEALRDWPEARQWECGREFDLDKMSWLPHPATTSFLEEENSQIPFEPWSCPQ